FSLPAPSQRVRADRKRALTYFRSGFVGDQNSKIVRVNVICWWRTVGQADMRKVVIQKSNCRSSASGMRRVVGSDLKTSGWAKPLSSARCLCFRLRDWARAFVALEPELRPLDFFAAILRSSI